MFILTNFFDYYSLIRYVLKLSVQQNTGLFSFQNVVIIKLNANV
jgi:hypothetical protein